MNSIIGGNVNHGKLIGSINDYLINKCTENLYQLNPENKDIYQVYYLFEEEYKSCIEYE